MISQNICLNISTNQLELVLPEEKQFILNTYNKPINLPITKTVIDLFEEKVAENPDKLALCFGNTKFTYKELNNCVNYLADYLYENNIETTVPVFAKQTKDILKVCKKLSQSEIASQMKVNADIAKTVFVNLLICIAKNRNRFFCFGNEVLTVS